MDTSKIKFYEQISSNAWPSLKTLLYDGWVLRISDGVTRRANSINPIFNSNINPAKKIQFCENLYKSFGLPVIFKMTSEVCPIDLNKVLKNSGYEFDAETSVQTISIEKISSASNNLVTINETFEDGWLERSIEFNEYSKSKITGFRNILNQIILKKGFLDLRVNGKFIGCGLGVVEDEYVGLFDLVVDPNYRKQGFGKIIIESLVNWGKMNGAKTAYLQVMTDNHPALSLYKKIGFKEIYKYWYRVKNK